MSTSTALRTYFRGPTLVSMRDEQAGTKRYYHFDHQGTVQCLTDSTGAVTDRFASDAWGVQVKRTGSSINRQWYIGRSGYYRHVDQALDYVRARYLAPGLGAFVACDRLSSGLRMPEPYAYASNRPAYLIDPTGQLAVSVFRKNKSTTCGSWDLAFNFTLNRPAPPSGGYMVQMVTIANGFARCNKKAQAFPSLVFWEALAVEAGQVKFFKRIRLKPDVGTDISVEPAHPNRHGSASATGKIKFFSSMTLARYGVGGGSGSLHEDPTWWNGKSGTVPQSGDAPSTSFRPAWFSSPSDDPPDGARGVSSEWCCCPPAAWSLVKTSVGSSVVDTTRSGKIGKCCP